MVERYVGIDLGIRTQHKAAISEGAEQIGKSFSFDVSRDGFEKLLKRATKGATGPVHFVFEPTGLAWVNLASYLSQAGHKAYSVKPQKASDFRKFLRKHTKSDRIDAFALARIAEVDPRGVNKVHLPTAEESKLLRLVKRRDRMTRDVGKQKLRIHALLVLLLPSYISAMADDAFGKASLMFLRRHVDPEKVVRKGLAWLRRFWKKHSKNNAAPERVEKVFEACKKDVALNKDQRATGKLPFDYVAMQEELSEEIDLLERFQNDADRLEKQIVKLHIRLDPHRTLQQIYGIGNVIAAGIDAIVGNIERFRNEKAFTGFTGLCPRKSQSGNSDPSMPITKSGHRLLKMYLYLAADTARRFDPEFAAYYAKRYAKGDHHKRIVTALARKMAARVYALLKRRAAARRENKEADVTYELRSPDGSRISAVEARELIAQKYVRSVVDSERDARDRARRGKVAETPQLANKWPPQDATGEATTSQPRGVIPISRETSTTA